MLGAAAPSPAGGFVTETTRHPDFIDTIRTGALGTVVALTTAVTV